MYAYREQNKPALWRLLSYMPKYLRSCDVIELVVLPDWVVKSKCAFFQLILSIFAQCSLGFFVLFFWFNYFLFLDVLQTGVWKHRQDLKSNKLKELADSLPAFVLCSRAVSTNVKYKNAWLN